MTAVPAKAGKTGSTRHHSAASKSPIVACRVVANTDGESQRSQDVDDLDAQVKVVKVLLKNSWRGKKRKGSAKVQSEVYPPAERQCKASIPEQVAAVMA